VVLKQIKRFEEGSAGDLKREQLGLQAASPKPFTRHGNHANVIPISCSTELSDEFFIFFFTQV